MKSLLAVVFASLLYQVRGSASNIDQAQCSLYKAQIHLAYMGVLLSDPISKMAAFASENDLYNAIAAVIYTKSATSIISDDLKDQIIKNNPCTPPDVKFQAPKIAELLADFAYQVLPFPIKIGVNTHNDSTSLNKGNLKTEIQTKLTT